METTNFTSKNLEFDFYELLTYYKSVNPSKNLLDKNEINFTVNNLFGYILIEDLNLVFFDEDTSIVLELSITNDFLDGPWIKKIVSSKKIKK